MVAIIHLCDCVLFCVSYYYRDDRGVRSCDISVCLLINFFQRTDFYLRNIGLSIVISDMSLKFNISNVLALARECL